MITRDALYTKIESLIEDAVIGDALFDAVSYRNLRGDINTATRIVRIECIIGKMCMTTETKRQELNVESTIQCWVMPSGTEESDLDTAMDASFEMAREIFEGIASDTALGGAVCDAYFDEFETGYANLGAARRGVTYLDGTINQAS